MEEIILEIKQGVGGKEASLFANDLFQIYSKFAQKKGFKIKILDIHKTELGGIKSAILKIEGKDVYKFFKNESGVHRVQRIPKTEKYGRIHTSTASVLVYPYNLKEINSIKINPKDINIETFRASGPGGQYVNTTDTAVRITHIPTGITVACQTQRSQYKNREYALKLLKAKLYLLEQQKAQQKLKKLKDIHIKDQKRAFKIRTYNFKENRITDHRIKKTFYNLDKVLKGELELIIKPYLKFNKK